MKKCRTCGIETEKTFRICYCSKECYEKEKIRWKKVFKCKTCGKESKERRDASNQYCSNECWHKSGKKKFGEYDKKARCIKSQETMMKRYGKGSISWERMSEEGREKQRQKASIRMMNRIETSFGWYGKHFEYESPIAGKVYLQSTWEFVFVKKLDELGISWKRSEWFEYHDQVGQLRRYKPDFLIEDKVYIEISPYTPEKKQWKIDQVSKRIFLKVLSKWDEITKLTKDEICSWINESNKRGDVAEVPDATDLKSVGSDPLVGVEVPPSPPVKVLKS